MRPYYEDRHTAIYHADARDAVDAFPPVGLLLTDPSYPFRSSVMMNELPPYGMTQLPPLSQSPSEGNAKAHAEVGKIVELAKRFPNEVPASADRLRSWLEKMLDAEYTGEDLSKRPLDAEGNPIPN